MFRDEEDYNKGFNYFALALYKTESTGLAEAFMSTHTHQMVQTSDPKEFMYNFRQPYSKYFNHKYQKTGKLGEKTHFTMEVAGYHHLLAAISYTLRNPLHHGVASIPYAYPHCSANAIFRREMGKLTSERGVFLRESVLDIPQVENLFVTPRAYNYYMSRKSSEEWVKEQAKDGNGLAPVNLALIENGILLHNPDQMQVYEAGKADYRKMTDIELCTMLDDMARTIYGKHSVYQLTRQEKTQIAEEIYRKLHLNEALIRRCLVFPI